MDSTENNATLDLKSQNLATIILTGAERTGEKEEGRARLLMAKPEARVSYRTPTRSSWLVKSKCIGLKTCVWQPYFSWEKMFHFAESDGWSGFKASFGSGTRHQRKGERERR